MASYSAQYLSGSTTGLPIPVAATASPGTLIHTAVAGTTGQFDEVYLLASNTDTVSRTITIQWGGTTDPANDLVYNYSIPGNSPPIPLGTGQRIGNSLVIRAWASVASVINITGNVNRIS